MVTNQMQSAVSREYGNNTPKPAIGDAIVRTIAYVDVFDFPLTAAEVHRYLVGVAALPERVNELLDNGRLVPRRLAKREGFFTLPGREHIVDIRLRRQRIASKLWPVAERYGRLFAALPFIRMVAVTGSLAVDNAVGDADIDYLIVTEPGRLWLSRATTIIVVRAAARRGFHLCPNYFLSENALVFEERNLYTAHELVQMVPVAGFATYRRMRELNQWTADFLPNATYACGNLGSNSTRQPWQRLKTFGEAVLRTRVASQLERWEMERKIAKFSRAGREEDAETAFSADRCKGHFDGHGQRVLDAYENRVHSIE
jgi:hypothetical protein